MNRKFTRTTLCFLAATGAVIFSSAFAASTSQWVQKSETDFAAGELDTVVASNLGQLKLSRALTERLKQDPRVSIVYAVQQATDGSVYLGTGPNGLVLRIKDDKASDVFTAGDGVLVTAMQLTPDGKLLAGLSGDKARLIRIDPATGKSEDLFKSDDVQYIWAIAAMPDGATVVATGPAGLLYEIDKAGASKVLFKAKEHNVLCILKGDGDDLYIGTDPGGLVIRVNRKTGEWFVLYNAAEPEIVALARDKAGRLYAAGCGTTEAGGEEAATEATGQPERAAAGLPLKREAPPAPKPPELPNPAPGEPKPIPKEPETVKHLLILPAIQASPSKPGGGPASRPASHATTLSIPGMPSPSPKIAAPENGSAIYRIEPAGFVTEIFRKPVTIHAMVENAGSLIVGTGPEGLIYQVDPDTQETAALTRVESRQISTLSTLADGKLLLGLSNPGGLSQMDAGYANSGTFSSIVFDATQVARFGKIQLEGTLADGTTVTVQTRSGNTSDPEKGGWSKWSDAMPATQFLQIPSPSARFFQYKLTLATRDPKSTPTVAQVKTNYLLPNMPPKVTNIRVEAQDESGEEVTAKSAAPTSHAIMWDASDPNDDKLAYALYFRLGTRGPWILLKDKLKDTTYQWNTRQLADGRYQIRVVASDAASNPAGQGLTGQRVSDTVVIDNTGPAIGDVQVKRNGGKIEVSARIVDQTSTIASADYALDSSDDWQAVESSDMLFDSPDETVKFAVSGLSAGQHQLTLRAKDSHGNATYETLIVSIDQATDKK